ncbi:MAG: DUF1015 family protein [Bacteroidota bacterium]
MVLRPFTAAFPAWAKLNDSAQFLATVRERFSDYKAQDLFLAELEPAMYAYQISLPQGSKIGLIAAVSIQDYLEERVKRHEHTLVAKEVKQAELLRERDAVVKPVLLAHRPHQALADLLRTYVERHSPTHELHLPDGDETHRFWKITTGEDLEQIQYYFGRYIRTTYIADGHHRFSAFARLYQQLADGDQRNPYGYLMCALFPSNQLLIHNFNRVVKNADEQGSALRFLAQLSQFADLTPLDSSVEPENLHELTFYIKGEWMRMRWRQEIIQQHQDAGLPTMDVTMLNHYVLNKILGFADIRNDKRIKYIEGPRGLAPLEKMTDEHAAVAFCMHPLSWDSFFRVIDHGLVLPPKSTWFEPRMKNGLVVQTMRTQGRY